MLGGEETGCNLTPVRGGTGLRKEMSHSSDTFADHHAGKTGAETRVRGTTP